VLISLCFPFVVSRREEMAALFGKPSVDAPLIERIDYFFSAPENTSAVGNFLHTEAPQFALFESTDDRLGLESFALFKRYGGLVEALMERFCVEEVVSMEEVGHEIYRQLEEADNGPSPYICVSYIAGALDVDNFADLVVDVNAITNYRIDDSAEPEENQSD
jgi:hypothetical protein